MTTIFKIDNGWVVHDGDQLESQTQTYFENLWDAAAKLEPFKKPLPSSQPATTVPASWPAGSESPIRMTATEVLARQHPAGAVGSADESKPPAAETPAPTIQPAAPTPPAEPTVPSGQPKRGRGRPRKTTAPDAGGTSTGSTPPGPAAPAAEVPPAMAAAKTYTPEDIRNALDSVNTKCGLQLCRDVLSRVGARRLSDVLPASYNDFIALCATALEKGAV